MGYALRLAGDLTLSGRGVGMENGYGYGHGRNWKLKMVCLSGDAYRRRDKIYKYASEDLTEKEFDRGLFMLDSRLTILQSILFNATNSYIFPRWYIHMPFLWNGN